MDATTAPACPKHMEYGPCGGVGFDGTCEVSPEPCAFLGAPTIRWAGLDRSTPAPPPAAAVPEAQRMRELLRTRPIVVADLSVRALSADAIAQVGRVLDGRLDAVLAGDGPTARVQFPPVYRALLLQRAGLTPWAGVNCRDRNRVALEGELAALADAGAAGVHCVTGDHTEHGDRPDAAPVFDLDSTETAALAAAAGHLVSVGESPAAPPAARRAARVVEKLRAGAEVCFVNHCGGVVPARVFVDEVRAAGGEARFIACVPVVVDGPSAALLRTFTTLALPDGFLDRILDAPDARHAGVDEAVRLADAFLEAGFDGVDLSGGRDGGDAAYAEALAEIAERIGVVA